MIPFDDRRTLSTSSLKRKRHAATDYLDEQDWDDFSDSDLEELQSETEETRREYSRELDEANDCDLIAQLLGEATSSTSHSINVDLPVRILTNFALIDASSGEYISPDDVDAEGGHSAPVAWGDVKPCYNEEDDNYSDITDQDSDASGEHGLEAPLLHVQISSILTVDVNHTSKITLRTMYAFYVLDVPAAPYREYYESLWIRQRLTALVCEIISQDAGVSRALRRVNTLERFIGVLQIHEDKRSVTPDIAFEAQRIIGRQHDWADLKNHRDSIITNIRDFRENESYYGCDLDLRHALFKAIRDASFRDDGIAPTEQEDTAILGDSGDDDSDDYEPDAGNQTGDEGRERSPQNDPPDAVVERQPPLRSKARGPGALPKPAARRLRRPRQKALRHSEPKLLRHFTRPHLPRLVKRNAAEFFEQVKKMGQQPDHIASSHASPTSADDSHGMDLNRPEAVFGSLGPNDVVSANTKSRHPFSPSLVQCADAVVPRAGGIDFRPAVKVDDTVFKPGDFVSIELLKDSSSVQETPPNKSVDPHADTHRFALILHIRVDPVDQMAVHVLWLQHSFIHLEEGHHPRELFLTECCGTMHPRLLKRKIKVDLIDPRGSVPKYTGYSDPWRYFSRWLWDFGDSSIRSLPPLPSLNKQMQLDCLGCKKILDDVDRDAAKRWEISNGQTKCIALAFNGVEYHNGDFVYLTHSEQKSPRLLGIARIVDVGRDGSTVKALKFKRCFGRIPETTSQRHLALFLKGGQDERLCGSSIDIRRFAGKCQVIHTTAWLARPDVPNGEVFGSEPHLYHADEVFTTPGPNPVRRPLNPELLAACKICPGDTRRKEERLRQAPLALMDVFCGAGGMSQGFVRAGLAKAAYAIDISPSSCATYRILHPESKVICDDVNNVLNSVATAQRSQPADHFRTIFGKRFPDFPKKGDVDIVSLTPPCTGFSGLNRFKSAMDLRNTYIVSGLAIVEHLRPDYVIIENVVTMARFPLRARDSVNGRLVGGIKWGPHKFILRTLMDLGYQVRFGLLDAANYGAPQTRRRMIYMAARQGLKLPTFPLPTHHSTALTVKPLKASWGFVPTPPLSQSFAHLQVTIRDAIGDLPRFDWHDPELQENEWPAIRTRGDRRCGLPERGNSLGYRMQSFTDYQRWVRGNHDSVSHHYTMVFDDVVTKRVTHVTMEPRSSHLSLPKRLEMNALVGTTGAAARQRLYPLCYGRLDERGQFQTIVSRCHPSHRQGEVLHPNQRRVLTVREWARAQGFPDMTDFKSTTDCEADRYRQIGNAIPILLAMALARSFIEVL